VKRKREETERLPPFVPLLIDTMDTPAWRALSHGAKALYVAIRRRYHRKIHNNGRLFLSQRLAAKELASHHNEIARWFRELQYYGFIEMTRPGGLGDFSNGGRSTHPIARFSDILQSVLYDTTWGADIHAHETTALVAE